MDCDSMEKKMERRLISLAETQMLNPKSKTRRWVNKVEPDQYYLFEEGGIFGPKVRPLLYDQFTGRWVLVDDKERCITIFERSFIPFEFVTGEQVPLGRDDVVDALVNATMSPNVRKIEPKDYGGRPATPEELRKWHPWNLVEDEWARWIRYPVASDKLAAINRRHDQRNVWQNGAWDAKNGFVEFWGPQFRPVLSADENAALPLNPCLTYHMFEKTFYFYREMTSHILMARLLDPVTREPAALDTVLDWIADSGYDDYDLWSTEMGVQVVPIYKIKADGNEDIAAHNAKEEAIRANDKILRPWSIDTHGLPGDDEVKDWKTWLPYRNPDGVTYKAIEPAIVTTAPARN